MSTTEGNQGASQVYELSYLLLPSIPEDEIQKVAAKIEKIIENHGGQKFDGEAPFLRELAYEMSKVVGASRYVVKNAYLGWTKFDLPAEASAEEGLHPAEAIKAEVEKMQEVLRMLLIKTDKETKFTFASARLAKEAEIAGGEELESEESSEDTDDSNDDSGEEIDTEESVVE